MNQNMNRFSRRAFLTESSLVLGTIVLCGCSHQRPFEGDGQTPSNYYTSRKEELLKGFDGLRKHARPILVSSYGEEFANAVDADSRRQFESLIPEIPYVGGDRNDLSQELAQSAMALAVYRSMHDNGKSVNETGELLYRTVESMADSYPTALTRAVGFYQMSAFGRRKVQRAAQESQKRQYSSDWVFHYVEGDGRGFDWGIDYEECGIVKFLHAQGADDLTPYLCLADFPMSKALGWGLVRTTTLAEGAEKCDFRFKRGRQTQSVTANARQ